MALSFVLKLVVLFNNVNIKKEGKIKERRDMPIAKGDLSGAAFVVLVVGLVGLWTGQGISPVSTRHRGWCGKHVTSPSRPRG